MSSGQLTESCCVLGTVDRIVLCPRDSGQSRVVSSGQLTESCCVLETVDRVVLCPRDS